MLVANEGSAKPCQIIFWGNLCIDYVYDVDTYPKENTTQRAKNARKCLGGNGANSTRVLAQLRGVRNCVRWVGSVSRLADPDTTFALSVLNEAGVDTSAMEEVGGDGLPSSFVLSSLATGTRTIVSTRNGVRELSLHHFVKIAQEAFSEVDSGPSWCHFECRCSPSEMVEFATAWRSKAKLRSPAPPLSVEIEKASIQPDKVLPLLKLADIVFFSQDFIEAHHDTIQALALSRDTAATEPTEPDPPTTISTERLSKRQKHNSGGAESWETHQALQCLRCLRKLVHPVSALWFVGWGDHGAFALEAESGRVFFEPAHLQPKVVDSVGAGDTFIAACIHALMLSADIAGALRCGCAVAGRKVGQIGFTSLNTALPSDLK